LLRRGEAVWACIMVAAGWPLFGAVDRGHEWPLLAEAV